MYENETSCQVLKQWTSSKRSKLTADTSSGKKIYALFKCQKLFMMIDWGLFFRTPVASNEKRKSPSIVL